jgi:hypothetical protein
VTISVTSPITGGAQTGLTSPTYTIVADTAPDVNGKQWAVTALGGTQTGVIAHSVAAPFTVTVTRPKVFRVLGKPNPTTGLVKDVPMNTYGILVRKGVLPLAGQPYAICMMKVSISIPAGSDTTDAANLRAACSCLVGVLSQQSAGVGDTAVSGILG